RHGRGRYRKQWRQWRPDPARCRSTDTAPPHRNDLWEHYGMDNHPPEEAYGRVTNPERFQPVVDAALALIDDLTVRYQVVRSSGISSVDFPTLEGAPLDTVRLTPD